MDTACSRHRRSSKSVGVCVVQVVIVGPEAMPKVILANAGTWLLYPRKLTVRKVVFDDMRDGRRGDTSRVLLYPEPRERS